MGKQEVIDKCVDETPDPNDTQMSAEKKLECIKEGEEAVNATSEEELEKMSDFCKSIHEQTQAEIAKIKAEAAEKGYEEALKDNATTVEEEEEEAVEEEE